MPKLSEIVGYGAPAPSPSPTPDTSGSVSTPGEAYTQYIGGPALDYFQNFMEQALPGHPLNKVIPSMVVPETLTQAAVMAGTLLAPEAKAAQYFGSAARNYPKAAAMIDRLMPSIGAGALGGIAEKGDIKDALQGAVIGAATGVPAEAASGVSRWYAGSKLAQRFFKEDPEAVTNVVKRLVPEFGKTIDADNVGRAFWRGAAQDKISEVYDKRMTAIAEKAIGLKFTAPAYEVLTDPIPMIRGNIVSSPRIKELQKMGVLGREPTTVERVMQQIRDLRLKGRTAGGDPKLTLEGRQARDYAAEVSADLKVAMEKSVPDGVRLAKEYAKTDKKYAKGAEMIRYLKQEGIVDDNGALDMGLLQQQLKEERAFGLSHIFSPKEFEDVMSTVFRGGPDTVVDKIIGSTDPHVRMHAGETGRFGLNMNLLSMLRNNKYAGNYDVDFLKPKGPQLLLQRLGAGVFKDIGKPMGSTANTLAGHSEE